MIPTKEKIVEKIDEIRYEIEDVFDNSERSGGKVTLREGKILAEKIEDKVKSFIHTIRESDRAEMVKMIVKIERKTPERESDEYDSGRGDVLDEVLLILGITKEK